MRKFLTLLLVVAIFCSSVTPVQAAQVQPYYNNTMSVSSSFIITSSGEAIVAYSITGYEDYFKSAITVIYIEKLTLGLFWTRVDNGMPDKEWSDFTSIRNYINEHSIQLESRGTYRAVFEFNIMGTGGPRDVIESIEEATW